MAATAALPPDPADGQPVIHSSASSPIPIPRPRTLLDEQIPEHLLHGGVGRAANSGPKRSDNGANVVGVVGGQDFVDGGNPQMGEDGGGKNQLCKKMAEQIRSKKPKGNTKVSQVQVGEGKHRTENEPPMTTSKKSINNKGHLPISSKSSRCPIQVASSSGVNMLAKSAASKRASPMVSSASLKRAKMEGSPRTSQEPPTFTMAHVSPSLEDLSPGARTTNSLASKRKRCKYGQRLYQSTEMGDLWKADVFIVGKYFRLLETKGQATSTDI